MTPAEWLQHASEGVVVLGATAAMLRRAARQLARFEKAVEQVEAVGDLKRQLEAHIATPAHEAHGIRASQPSHPSL